MSSLKKYFRALGIPPTDNQDVIKKAYRQMALKYHPDRNDSPEAHQKFIEVIEAYEVLSGQRKAKIISTPPKRKTKEEIIAEKVKAAKERWEKQQADEHFKDAVYYKKVAFGWKWTLFKIASFYTLLFTILLCIDTFSISEYKTIRPEGVFYNPINHSIFVEKERERFGITNHDFWHPPYSPIRGNYSWLFHDLRSVSIIVDPYDEWQDLKHSAKMKKYATFETYELESFTSSDSIYSVFPFVHIVLLAPILLVVFKRPTLRFNIWRLVSIWIIFPFFVFLTFSNDRIFHLFRFFE